MTTETQIAAVRTMCVELAQLPNIKSAYVDDWGQFGNFQVMVTPVTPDRHTTNRLKALVRKQLPDGAMLREVFGPDPITERTWNGRNRVTGYARNYWVVDVDFQHYDPTSNTFSS